MLVEKVLSNIQGRERSFKYHYGEGELSHMRQMVKCYQEYRQITLNQVNSIISAKALQKSVKQNINILNSRSSFWNKENVAFR